MMKIIASMLLVRIWWHVCLSVVWMCEPTIGRVSLFNMTLSSMIRVTTLSSVYHGLFGFFLLLRILLNLCLLLVLYTTHLIQPSHALADLR